MAVVRRTGLATDNGYTNPYGVGADRTTAKTTTYSTPQGSAYAPLQAGSTVKTQNLAQNILQNALSADKFTTGAISGNRMGVDTPMAQLESSLAKVISTTTPVSQNEPKNEPTVDVNAGGGNGTGNGVGVVPTAPSQSMDYMSQLSAMLQAQQAQQQAQLAAQQVAKEQAVRNAYNSNLSSLQNAYANRTANLGNTLDSTLAQLGENYDYSAEKIAQNAENALREAYVNRMLSQKNLQQQLNAQGLTGGAAESAIAGLLNNYGNARNNIETQRMNNLADLLNMYQNNVATAREKYNTALNDIENANYNYQAQMQRDLANGVVGTYDDLYSALASGANTYANAMEGLAASQVGNAADLAATNYKNYLNTVNSMNNAAIKANAKGSTAGTGGGDSSILAAIQQRLAGGNALTDAEITDYLTQLTANGMMTGAQAVAQLRKMGVPI